MMKKKRYERINFVDHTVQYPNRVKVVENDDGTVTVKKDEGVVIEQGTPHSANVMNRLDQGIDEAHLGIHNAEKEIEKMKVQLELDGRVPNSNGSFFDVLDGSDSRNIKLDTTKADVTESIVASTLTIPVSSTVGFKIFTEVTMFDDVNMEDVTITAIDESLKTITVNKLVNGYKKGAIVARSTINIDTKSQEMNIEPWGTYSISEVV